MDNKDELNSLCSRIIFSNEFKRLQNKTQLFYASNGDHYRTRLTHTIEVEDIAMEIARRINLIDSDIINLELVKIIALAHDLGHTPFGHVGERTLNAICSGEDPLGNLLNKELLDKRFKHNIYSAILLEKSDEIFRYEGILESLRANKWIILDGISKHTKPMFEKLYFYDDDKKENQIYKDKYNISIYANNTFLNSKNLNDILRKSHEENFKKIKNTNADIKCQYMINYYNHCFPLTLEGQIVSIADEIAQRVSDFNDTITSNSLNKEWKILTGHANFLEKEIKKFKNADKKIQSCLVLLKKSFNYLSNDEMFFSEKMIKSDVYKFSKQLREALISDVILNYQKKKEQNLIKETLVPYKKSVKKIYLPIVEEVFDYDNLLLNNDKYEEQSIINFTYYGKIIDNLLNEFNIRNVLSLEEIRKSDGIAKHKIRNLFKAYYNNPNQLDAKVLEKIFMNFKNIINEENNEDYIKYLPKNFIDAKDKYCISDDKITDRKTIKSFKQVISFQNIVELCNKCKKMINDNNFKKDANNNIDNKENISKANELLKKLYVSFIMEIIYYIAGMTDSFLEKEEEKLYF